MVVTEADIVREIRKQPNMEEIAQIIEHPTTYSLIRMLITQEKYGKLSRAEQRNRIARLLGENPDTADAL